MPSSNSNTGDKTAMAAEEIKTPLTIDAFLAKVHALDAQDAALYREKRRIDPGQLAIGMLSQGMGNPAVMFGHGKTIEQAVVEQALDRIKRNETELARVSKKLLAYEQPVVFEDEQTKWPISTEWLFNHGLLRLAMTFCDFPSITPDELMADSPFLYLTRDELKKLEEAI